MQFDNRGRVQSVTYPDGQVVTYTYDGVGNRLTMTDELGQTTYGYDATNRLVRKTDPFGRTLTYAYTGQALTSMTSPVGTESYQYDQMGRVTQLDVTGGVSPAQRVKYQYDGLSQLTIMDRYEVSTTGVETLRHDTQWTRDTWSRPTQTKTTQSGATKSQFGYTYGLLGQVLTDSTDTGTGTVINRTYTYDSMGRLTRADESGTVYRTYSYDPAGNRLGKTDVNGSATTEEAYQYDAANRLLSLAHTEKVSGTVQKQRTANYEYDANGNQTRAIDSGLGTTSYKYDARNLLLEATQGGGSRVTNRYDGDGVKLFTEDSHNAVSYLMDRGQILAELDPAGAVIASTWRGVDGSPLFSIQRLGVYYDHADRLGSVQVLTSRTAPTTTATPTMSSAR